MTREEQERDEAMRVWRSSPEGQLHIRLDYIEQTLALILERLPPTVTQKL